MCCQNTSLRNIPKWRGLSTSSSKPRIVHRKPRSHHQAFPPRDRQPSFDFSNGKTLRESPLATVFDWSHQKPVFVRWQTGVAERLTLRDDFRSPRVRHHVNVQNIAQGVSTRRLAHAPCRHRPTKLGLAPHKPEFVLRIQIIGQQQVSQFPRPHTAHCDVHKPRKRLVTTGFKEAASIVRRENPSRAASATTKRRVLGIRETLQRVPARQSAAKEKI